MKAIILPIFLFSINLNAQIFTKITTGEIVNTPSDSRSVNWIDFNNDGFQDLMITNGSSAGANNLLYKNNGDGTFSSIISSPIVTDNKPSVGATWADFDNNGFIDCFVTNWYGQNNLFYINNGNGVFSQALNQTLPLVNDAGYSETAAWGDLNNDGLLDLVVSNSDGNKKNFLYLNADSQNFNKVQNGALVNDAFHSRCINLTDFDNDGDLDVFVTNENNENENLYENDGNANFTKNESYNFTNNMGNSMTSSWADIDNDGDLDLFIGNFQGFNALYINNGINGFSKNNTDTISKTFAFTFGSNFGDIDNDGDLDLITTNAYGNGFLRNFLYINDGLGNFSKNESEVLSQDSGWSYGCAFADYNNDGFLDLAIANNLNGNQKNSLYKNNTNLNSWIEIKCQGSFSNYSAIGAKVRLKAQINGNSVWQMREISSQSGYCGQNMLNVHFGLGNASNIDSLIIEWPSGTEESFSNLMVNQMLTATENNGITGTKIIKKNDAVIDNLTCFPNPFKEKMNFTFSIQQREWVKIEILDKAGNLVEILHNQYLNIGQHHFNWDASKKQVSGIYFLKISASKESIIEKINFVK